MKTLTELQAADLPRADWRTFLKADGLTPEDESTLTAYFSRFVEPGPCIMCGAQQSGDMLQQALGLSRFTWGLAHGEGYCSARNCSYPGRAYHYDIGPIKRLTIILQYHPGELKTETDDDDCREAQDNTPSLGPFDGT